MPNPQKELDELSRRETEEHRRSRGLKVMEARPIKKSAGDKLTPDAKLTPDDRLTSGVKLPGGYILGDGTPVNPHCVRPQGLAQDGHTPSEHLAYLSLWRAGGGEDRGDSVPYRDVSIGQTAIARQASISKRNLIRVLESLDAKLSIETLQLQTSADHTAKTYRVWSMKEILRRRRSAGFCWVYRNRNVTALVRRAEAKLSPDDSLTPGDSLTAGATLSPGASVAPGPGASLAGGAGASLAPPLGSSLGTTTQESSSSLVGAAFRRYAPVDDDAVDQLLKRCKAADPLTTDEEIIHFIEEKGDLARRRRNIDSMVGFLLTAVPNCFEGAGLFQYRSAKKRELQEAAEEDRLAAESAYQTARETLADPLVSESDKEMARELLEPTAAAGKVSP